MKSHFKMGREEYKKPPRVCPFCNNWETQLSRHIQLKHKHLPDVQSAMKLPEKSEERKLAFAKFRKDGILKHNTKQASEEGPSYQSERRNQSDIVLCSKCKGFYGRRLFHRHKELCVGDGTFCPQPIHMVVVKEGDDQFTQEVLSSFHQNDLGNLCRTDETIVMIGKRLFQKNLRKVDKTMETKKSVAADMRLLGKLYIAFKDICTTSRSSEDMFRRKNFAALEDAIDIVTKSDGILKYGVKNQLYHLLKSSVEIIVANHISNEEDKEADEIEKFKRLLDLNKHTIFGDAAYAIHLSRQQRLRMPEQKAEEVDVQRLSQHIRTTVEKNSSQLTFVGVHEYVDLRDSVCARLTLFNARRGGEPSRLKLTQLQDAWDDRWIDTREVEKLEEWEQKLFQDFKIAYQPGKGNHLVPVLIPQDLVPPLKILADEEIREQATISRENLYVFPNTGQSINHVHGWNAINKMCLEAGVKKPELLTATKQRHRVSTLYCAMEVPDSEREHFYKHMGHSRSVNLGTYQYPLPVLEVTKVGKHLQQIDNAMRCSEKSESACSDSCSKDQSLSSQSSTSTHHVEEECRSQTSNDMRNESENVPTNRRKRNKRCIIYSSEDSDSDCHESTSVLSAPTIPKERGFFRWSATATEEVKADFKDWIHLPQGNKLPSKANLEQYLEGKNFGCTYLQLRTKLMNEQNKNQARKKKRFNKMLPS